MTEAIPPQVLAMAMQPFDQEPMAPPFRVHRGELISAMLHPLPMTQVVWLNEGVGPELLGSAIDEARAVVTGNGGKVASWWNTDELDWLGPALEQRGLRNEDSPGFEAVENVMCLVTPPAGGVPADVKVRLIDSFEDMAASVAIQADAFGFERDQMLADLDQRWADYNAPGNPWRTVLARLDGEPVGMAGAALWKAGINLFGAAVLPGARGRGVYRAMTHARWQMAVDRGTPALAIQAGRMSTPVVEALGFTKIASVRTYVDWL